MFLCAIFQVTHIPPYYLFLHRSPHCLSMEMASFVNVREFLVFSSGRRVQQSLLAETMTIHNLKAHTTCRCKVSTHTTAVGPFTGEVQVLANESGTKKWQSVQLCTLYLIISIIPLQCLVDHCGVWVQLYLIHGLSYSPGAHWQRRTGMVWSGVTLSVSLRSLLEGLGSFKMEIHASQCSLCILIIPTN